MTRESGSDRSFRAFSSVSGASDIEFSTPAAFRRLRKLNFVNSTLLANRCIWNQDCAPQSFIHQ
jgi:hypothetical protein